MDRDGLIDRLFAIACQIGSWNLVFDGQMFNISDVCIQAGEMLAEGGNHILSLEQATESSGIVYLEKRGSRDADACVVTLDSTLRNYRACIRLVGDSTTVRLDDRAYGKDWRCWKYRPTVEEMASENWLFGF